MMKRNRKIATLATAIMFAMCLTASAKGKDIERGMSKQEVMNILGKPKLKSFDENSDRWEYIKGYSLTATKYSVVVFDRSGRVIRYDTRLIDGNNDTAGNCQHYPTPPAYYDNNFSNPATGYCMDEAAFNILYNKIKKESFDDDKYNLLEVASLGCYYSCAQTVRIMKLFSFGNEQLKVLRIMAPRIVDPQNATDIYAVFTFDSDKATAGEIMRGCI